VTLLPLNETDKETAIALEQQRAEFERSFSELARVLDEREATLRAQLEQLTRINVDLEATVVDTEATPVDE
jgi:hypothetical protein